jgi:hypothetical protein
VSESFVYPAFDALVAHVAAARETRWVAIEDAFLAIVSEFDELFVTGQMDIGNYKAKARYFNDLIAHLLANSTGRVIATRAKRAGLSFPAHDVDVAYPAEASYIPLALGEVKIAGMPPYPGNVNTSGETGRPVSQDLDKRIREIGFTAIDLKRGANEAIRLTKTGGGRDFTPLYVAIYAARAASDGDLAATVRKLTALRDHYADAVGVFLYRAPNAKRPTSYEKVDPGQELRIDEVLAAFSTRVLGS